MTHSESIGQLAKSLSVVQSKLKPAVKDSLNPFYKNKYADLGSIWDSCRDLLAENGLSVVQTIGTGANGEHTITTMICHETGEYISDTTILPLTKIDSQAVGSAITYFRRYSLAAIVGIVSDDDDGEAASPKQPAKTQTENITPTTLMRIRKAEKAIQDLGGQVQAFNAANKSEAEQLEELTALTDQFKRLREAK